MTVDSGDMARVMGKNKAYRSAVIGVHLGLVTGHIGGREIINMLSSAAIDSLVGDDISGMLPIIEGSESSAKIDTANLPVS